MIDEQECPECPQQAGWITTFADLMSLLMCFFVLLLSFAELDVVKYKQIAGSLRSAFGVQRQINAEEIPKGTSVIAKEFSPGKPEPTPIVEIRQITTDDLKRNVEVNDNNAKQKEANRVAQIKKIEQEIRDSADKTSEQIKQRLRKEVGEGIVKVDSSKGKVIISIRENGSFSSGKADLEQTFYPVLRKISRVLNQVDGKIYVAGHTDNVPIKTDKYPSNWVLSAARAASVVHYLTSKGGLSPRRVEIRAHADMSPINNNKTAQNRAKNRRVEIVINDNKKLAKKLKLLQNK